MVSGEQAIVNQLCKISNDLISLRKLSKKKDEREVDIFFMNIPEDGGTRTFATGITKINFKTGVIVNPNGSTELLEINMGVRDFMHSLNVVTDKDIKIRLDSSKQHTISANNQETIPYMTFTSVGIECTESTQIALFVCTNPSTVLGSFMTVLKGQKGVVAQEVTGELITVIKGDQGVVAQDANNKLISVMQGNEGTDIKQKATGELIAELQGSESLAIKQKVTTGELIAIMQGEQGIDISQDVSGAMISLMKGEHSGNLKTLATDVDGNMIALMTGQDPGAALQTVALDNSNRLLTAVDIETKPSSIIDGTKTNISTVASQFDEASTEIVKSITVKCTSLGTGTYIAIGSVTSQSFKLTAKGDSLDIDWIDDINKIYAVTDAGNTGSLAWIGG